MSIRQHIDTYLKGWERGDGALSLSVSARSFCYDDPNTGRIQRHEFVEFAQDFKRAAVGPGASKDAPTSCNTATL